jgi:hypothetical protein
MCLLFPKEEKKKKTLILSLIEMMNKNVDVTKFIPLEPTLLWNNQWRGLSNTQTKNCTLIHPSIHPCIHPSIQECEGATYHSTANFSTPQVSLLCNQGPNLCRNNLACQFLLVTKWWQNQLQISSKQHRK